MPEFDIGTILLQLANFAILAVALYFLLFRPVMRNVREREAERERLAQETVLKQAESERLRAELDTRLARAEEEAAAIIAQAQDQARDERAALLQETQTQVERILVEAHVDGQRVRQQAVDDFHDELLDAILELSGWAISNTVLPEVHDTLVQQLNDRIWELGRSEMERVETFRRALGDRAPTAYVTTARPLSPEQQGLLARTFTALADRHVNLELRTDPKLAAGVQVRLGDTLVDNSISGQLAELRETVSRALKERMTGEPTE
jgi:F-type H+-transporting ATPase subunit b